MRSNVVNHGTLQMSKLRARMQSFRANLQPARPPSELPADTHTLEKETDAASQSIPLESSKHLQSHETSTSQQKEHFHVPESSVAADHPPAITLNTSRTSGSSWDRRFRQISTMLTPNAHSSTPAPTVKKEPAAQEADMLQQTARGIAELK